MRSKPQSFTVFVLIATLVFSTLTIAAQVQTDDQTNNWSRVTALNGGAKVSLKLKTGKSVNGTLKQCLGQHAVAEREELKHGDQT